MSIIQDGTYVIAKRDSADEGMRLSLIGDHENSPVVVDSRGLNGQEWKLTMRSDDNYVIENINNDNHLFLAPLELQENSPLVGKTEAFEWRIQQSAEKNRYHIVVPGGPIDGSELAADLSMLPIYPPRTALRPLQVDNLEQAWFLVKKDD